MDWERLQGTRADTARSWRFFRSTGSVVVFHVDLTPHSQREATAWEWLSSEERQRWGRFVYPGPGRRYTLCRAAVREILCVQLGFDNRELTFESSEFGKPYAVAQGKRASVDFNISHSGGHGLVAFSQLGRVGVDVEDRGLRRDLGGVVKTVFGPREQALLAGLDGERWLDAFLDLWTVKEALAKGWGMGLGTDFSRFEAPPEMLEGGTTGVFRSARLSDSAWLVERIGNAEFAAAVAYETGLGSGWPA